MSRIGEDVAEKLDYEPGVFTVERHVRGKWACAHCQTLVQAPVTPHVIDKGIPTTGLLAQVLVGKFADHLPLYRQEAIFGRAGFAIPRSTLAQWVGSCGVQLQPLVDALKAQILTRGVLHADETPVQMLKPGNGKTHRAYLWAYAPGAFEDIRAVVYDFCESRAGEHARTFLGDWKGSLVCDDFSGYKAGFTNGVTEAGCLAHARRKFFDLHVSNRSQVAETALGLIGQVYEIERELKELSADERQRIRLVRSKPVLDALHRWMLLTRQKITNGSATAKALDYSLNRWTALTRFVDDGHLPVDNNHIENQIRPIAIGRSYVQSVIMWSRRQHATRSPASRLWQLRIITEPAGTSTVRPSDGSAYAGFLGVRSRRGLAPSWRDQLQRSRELLPDSRARAIKQ